MTCMFCFTDDSIIRVRFGEIYHMACNSTHKKFKMQVYVYGEMGDNSKVMMELTRILEEGYSYKENNSTKGSDPCKMGSVNCSLFFVLFFFFWSQCCQISKGGWNSIKENNIIWLFTKYIRQHRLLEKSNSITSS